MSEHQPDRDPVNRTIPGMPEPATPAAPPAAPATAEDDDPRVVVVTPDGMGVANPKGAGDGDQTATNPADLVEEPAKVMRIGTMIKQLLEEVRGAPLDDAGRARLAEIHKRSLDELKDGLAPELVAELDRIALPFSDTAPSDAELRIAQAQLVGWLEGLFHGIQTALVAQQMAAQQQLQQMRALPPAPGQPRMPDALQPGGASGPGGQVIPGPHGGTGPTGQYL